MNIHIASAKLLRILAAELNAGRTIYYDHDHENPFFSGIMDQKSLSESVYFLHHRNAINLKQVYKCSSVISKGPKFDDITCELFESISNDYNELNLRVVSIEHQLETEKIDFQARVNHIVGFDLRKLRAEVDDVERKLAEISDTVNSSPELTPLTSTLSKLTDHFCLIAKMVKNYEDIYAGIIRPIQVEGESGIRATKKWAIMSIILSAIISTAASIAISALS